MADSFYEYMLKIWLQTDKTEPMYREMYDKAIDGMHKELLQQSTPSGLRYIAESNHGVLDKKMGHLVCFMGGLLALGAFPFYLQYARGTLRYHLIGNLALVVVLTPAIVLAAMKAGGVGAGWVWVAMNALYLVVWVGYVHSKLEPGLHWNWLVSNLVVIMVPTLAIGLVLSRLQIQSSSRLLAFGQVAAIAAVCVLVATMASSVLRPTFLRVLRARRVWSRT